MGPRAVWAQRGSLLWGARASRWPARQARRQGQALSGSAHGAPVKRVQQGLLQRQKPREVWQQGGKLWAKGWLSGSRASHLVCHSTQSKALTMTQVRGAARWPIPGLCAFASFHWLHALDCAASPTAHRKPFVTPTDRLKLPRPCLMLLQPSAWPMTCLAWPMPHPPPPRGGQAHP